MMIQLKGPDTSVSGVHTADRVMFLRLLPTCLHDEIQFHFDSACALSGLQVQWHHCRTWCGRTYCVSWIDVAVHVPLWLALLLASK